MGGKYEVIGWEYPYHDENDIHVYTDSWIKARRAYKKAKKMFYSAFITRNDKNINTKSN